MNLNTLGFHQPNECGDGQFILQQPNQFFSVLAEAVHDSIVFYSHDLEGRFTFLGHSTKTVLNLDPKDLLERKIQEIVSDNPINDCFRAKEWLASDSPAQRLGTCEIIDLGGSRVQADYWRLHVYRGGMLASVTGIIRRNREVKSNHSDISVDHAKSLFARIATLTAVERQVVEMAVDGHMNKKMANILDVAVRTIESRRSRAMSKLQVKTLSELVQLWIQVRRLESAGFRNSA